MNEDLVNSISERYIELYEQITGDTFVKSDTTDVMKRVEENIKDFLSVNV
ncbi:MAG: phosphoribosylaminoimidazolesuccinocarboxamide synthase, partial [Flavobacteriales bacterium]|nr:phosphoribosylaminoimidazolesuccinocarboxamide synthase [Flavobacteriales bacterium]